ncbi:hypothetical protein ACM61V_22530, partial [Sphingomonas sp. TX0543]|uniref:hypothetical protein n=1 Tax=Sphingomonas sp. TX0543 TaxID=3399682 RepID=UPI003AFB0122
ARVVLLDLTDVHDVSPDVVLDPMSSTPIFNPPPLPGPSAGQGAISASPTAFFTRTVVRAGRGSG